MKKHRILSAALAAALSLSLLTPATLAAEVSFEDVPANHWAYEDIAAMSEQGVVKGVGDNRFEPGTSVAITQFATMLERSFYADDLDNAPAGDYWWTGAMDVALTKGLLNDTTVNGLFATVWDKDGVEAPLTRYDMAQVMYNLLKAQGFEFPTETPNIPDAASIPENYRDAVNAMYALGLLKGTDSTGNFNGTMTMDRAQACAVMRRLIEAIEKWLKEHFGKPVDPTPTPTPTPSVPATDLELVNKGGSTGIDPQRPVESAPPISGIKIPSGMGLQVGESDEGLMAAGTVLETGRKTWITESEKYVQLSDDIIGTVKTEYRDLDGSDGPDYIRMISLDLILYVGDSVTLNLNDYGYNTKSNYWLISEGENYISTSESGEGLCTIKALNPVAYYEAGGIGYHETNTHDDLVINITIYEKKPSNWNANFHISTDYEPVYYTNGTLGTWWVTEKGVKFNGSNGVPAKSEFGMNADYIRIYPDSSMGIPSSDIENGYIKDEAVGKYFDFSCNLEEYNNRRINVGPTGGIETPCVDFTSSDCDHKATITVTSKKDGRSCSIDIACLYYNP